jgi:2-haloacid dehalogenase
MARIQPWSIDASRPALQASVMSRRDFLRLLPLASLSACASSAAVSAAPAPPRPRRKIRAICFDLFTLFDPRSVVDRAASLVGDQAPALCEAWRLRQFEYSWLHVAAEQYVDFRVVTEEALRYAAQARGLTLDAAARDELVDAYSHLAPWPDARASLTAWKAAGLELAPLSNYTPSMLARLLDNAGLTDLFTLRISTDAAKTFKPAPRAYALGESQLGLTRDEIAFAAFGGWDAAGAKWFGFPTFWVNRLGVPQEELILPDGSGPTLSELNDFVARW